MSGTANIFRIPVAKVTEAEAVERIVAIAKQQAYDNKRGAVGMRGAGGKREAIGKRAAFVATLNVDFVCNAVSGWPFGGNDELWGYLKRADLVTADGMPIVLLAKLLRDPLPERVTGADMVPSICRRFAEEGLSVYVLGGDKAVVEEAFAKLGTVNGQDARCPIGMPANDQPPTADHQQSTTNCQLKIAGIDDSFVKLDEDQPEIAERINAAKPDLLFVALGNPKQELWMGRNADRLDVSVMIGVGGTFNFITGKVKRAPRWVQRSGLEWVYRIGQEPGRLWRRYAYGFVKFSWLSLRAFLGGYK